MYYSASRVLAILDLLQTRGRMRGEELAERLSVDVRTVRRYVMILRDRGIPIDMKRGRYGGYALPSGYRAPLALSKQEALALANGLLREGVEQSDVATNDSGQTLKKIAHHLPRATRDLIQHLERAVIVAPASPAECASIDADHLETVVRAINSCSRLRIRYRAWTGEESARIIDPYKIVSRYGRWYLVGYCHLRSCQRVFRLDHLVGAAILPEMFQMPSIDALAVVEHAIAQTPWRWEYRVLVDMPLEELFRRIPRTMAVLEPQEHGVLMYGFAQDLDWLAYTLAGLQCSIVIVEPFELHAHFLTLANHVRAIGEQHD